VRIIAGSAKGTRLVPVPAGVRPVADRAREGLFSSLGGRVQGARILDLYCGTGALGIEALSRGAEGSFFVDRNEGALRATTDNLRVSGLADLAEVRRSDALAFLMSGDTAVQDISEGGVDIVLLDPPYDLGSPELDRVLEALATRGWLAEGWTVVLTRGSRSSMPVIPLHWAAARRLEYGDSLVVVFREE
jgi:16S rRNA (guanine966-N2)-methyltransferase